jgi:rod shape-determining protein MreC
MKNNKYKLIIVIIIILSVTFLCLIGYSSNRKKISFFRTDTELTINLAHNLFHNSFQFITNISKVKKENEELKKTNSELQSKALEYDSSIKENENLKSMVKFVNKRTNYNYIGADIIGIVGNSYADEFGLNVGKDKGIKKGMIAITGKGLVGQVNSVGNNWSIVQCVSNKNTAVAAVVQGKKDNNGIIKGYNEHNKPLAEIDRLSLDCNVKKGDTITTSGIGGMYPSGISIGKVLSVHVDKSEVMKSAIIELSVDLLKTEEVLIIKPKNPSV